MPDRPTRRVIALELAALAAAAGVALGLADGADWDPLPFGALLALSLLSDVAAVQGPASRVRVSGSFLAVILAVVFLGGAPGAVIGVTTILLGWVSLRYSRQDLLINLVAYAWFPLAAGIAFDQSRELLGLEAGELGFHLLVLGAFGVGLAVDACLIAGYSAYVERTRFRAKVARILRPILPSELASAVLAVAFSFEYAESDLHTLLLLAIVLLVLQNLMGALVLSQERADELDLRTKRLAGFQVALISALLRTLDLRDRMTARHSASVARYSREIAAAAGFSETDQDLAHTAGLLHDIGKFVLPDRILKRDHVLSEADWEQIRKHPEEGARIVGEIDGYRPVGELILAHHERIDGLGYPRGLDGEEIPALARIISVADAYDVMTARDSYREPIGPAEAIRELRAVGGTQLDAEYVEVFAKLLAGKDVAYRHGEDADFERELSLDRRIHGYANGDAAERLARLT